MAGYSVTFSVIDLASRQIESITKKIQQMRAPLERQARSVQQFADASGLKKMAEGFGEVGDRGAEAFESISRLVPAIGAITGAASIAGMAEFVRTWAVWGVELQRNADRIGATSQELQTFQNAALEAGGSVEDMTGGLKELTDTAAGAFTGRNTDAIAWFNRAGIAIRDANGHLRTTTQLLPEVLRYLDGIKNPSDRMTAALGLGGQKLYELDEDFRRSGQSIDRWMGKARQLPTLTNEQIEAEQRWKEANGQLEASFGSLAAQIGALAAEGMTPLLDSFNTFLTTHQPQIIGGLKDLQNQISTMLTEDKALVERLFGSIKSLVTLTPLKPTASEILAGSPLAAGLSEKEKMDILAADQNAKAPAPIPSFSDLFSGKVGVGEFFRGRVLQPSAPSTTMAPPPPPAAPGPPTPANENLPLGKTGALGGADYRQRAAGLTAQLAKDLNLTPTQAAGIVGNLGFESGGLQPGIHERGVAANQGGVGFAQWTGPRRREFEAWAAANRLDPKSDAANVGFLEHELKGKYAPFLAQLRNTSTLAESTRLTHQKYETPADVLSGSYASGPARLQFAQKALDAALPQVASNVPLVPGTIPAPAAPAPAQAAGKPAQVTGGPPVSGSVDVTITHKNPPPGAVVTASATGDATVGRPRTEQQQLSAA